MQSPGTGCKRDIPEKIPRQLATAMSAATTRRPMGSIREALSRAPGAARQENKLCIQLISHKRNPC